MQNILIGNNQDEICHSTSNNLFQGSSVQTKDVNQWTKLLVSWFAIFKLTPRHRVANFLFREFFLYPINREIGGTTVVWTYSFELDFSCHFLRKTSANMHEFDKFQARAMRAMEWKNYCSNSIMNEINPTTSFKILVTDHINNMNQKHYMVFDREHICESGPTNRKVVVTVML